MDRMIQRKIQVRHRRHLEESTEIDSSRQLLPGKRTNLRRRLPKRLAEPLPDLWARLYILMPVNGREIERTRDDPAIKTVFRGHDVPRQLHCRFLMRLG